MQKGSELTIDTVGFDLIISWSMARPLRVQYAGARYHLMSRGDRRELIFLDEKDRQQFLFTLGQACGKTGWQVHAYCLMSNHCQCNFVHRAPPNLFNFPARVDPKTADGSRDCF